MAIKASRVGEATVGNYLVGRIEVTGDIIHATSSAVDLALARTRTATATPTDVAAEVVYGRTRTATVTPTDPLAEQVVGRARAATVTPADTFGGGGMTGTLLDSSGNGNHGTEIGTAGTYTSPSTAGSAFGLSRNQTARAQGVNIGVLSTPSQFCIEGFFNLTDAASTSHLVAVGGNVAGAPSWGVFVDSFNRIDFIIRNSAGTRFDVISTAIGAGRHYFQASWDGATARLYLDAARIGTIAVASLRTYTFPLRIANSNSGAGSGGIIGDIDEIRYTTGAIRDTGATLVVPTAPLTADANTTGLWHFDTGGGGSGDIAIAHLALMRPRSATVTPDDYSAMLVDMRIRVASIMPEDQAGQNILMRMRQAQITPEQLYHMILERIREANITPQGSGKAVLTNINADAFLLNADDIKYFWPNWLPRPYGTLLQNLLDSVRRSQGDTGFT